MLRIFISPLKFHRCRLDFASEPWTGPGLRPAAGFGIIVVQLFYATVVLVFNDTIAVEQPSVSHNHFVSVLNICHMNCGLDRQNLK
jgi:hypothetical protein